MLIAHVGRPPAPHDLWSAWNLDPGIAVPLVLSVWLYVRALARVPDRLRPARARVAATGAAAALLIVALISPLDGLGTALASAHMVQHLLLTLAVAPLLAVGRPWELAPWALERPARKALGRRRRTWRSTGEMVARPWVAGLSSIVTLTVWHGQVMYEAALASSAIHAIEHLSFLATGVLFWVVLRRSAMSTSLDGSSVLLLFLVAMHGVFLSALMTFAGQPWYPSYASTAPAWGMSALGDQHLAGVIMWVWGSIVYVGAAVTAIAFWINGSEEPSLEFEVAGR